MGRKKLSKLLCLLVLVSMVFLLTACGGQLHSAAKMGDLEKTNTLIAEGADINDTSGAFGAPLHIASQRGHTDVARALINAGADLNIKGNQGWTALHMAAYGKHIEIAKILLEAGADESIRDSKHLTYIEAARTFRSFEFAKYFENVYPGERRAQLKKQKLEADNKAFALAGTAGTMEGWSTYLGDPDGKHRTEAFSSLATLLSNKQNRPKIKDYLKTYPSLAQHLPLKYALKFLGPQGLTVADLIKFKKQGVETNIIAVKVKTSNARYKNFNFDEVALLKSKGLTSSIVEAMLSSNASAIQKEEAEVLRQEQAKLAAEQAAQAAKQKASSGSACVVKRLAAVMACDQVPGGFIPQLACKAIVKKKFACN